MKRLIALVLAGQMAISGAFAQPVLAEEPATEDASAIQIEDEGADEKATEKITEKAMESPVAETSAISDVSPGQSAAESSDAPGTSLSDAAVAPTETPETAGDVSFSQKNIKISVSGDGNAALATEINDEKIREKIKGILQEREILTACSVDLYLNNTEKKEPEIEMEEEIEISPENFGLYYVAENASGAGDFVRIPFTYDTEKKGIRFSSDKSGFYVIAVLNEEEKEEREEEGKEEKSETETEDDGIEILDAGESLNFSAPMLKARLMAAPPAPANDEPPAKHPTGYIESLDDDDEYIEMFKILEQADGTAPYDSSDGLGYDANDHNGIVRTNDAIDYTLQLTSAPYTEGAYYRNGYIGFKFVLPGGIKPDEAEFSVEDMSWMVSGTGKYYDYVKKNEMIDGQQCQVLYAYMKLSSDTSGTPNMFPCIKQTANVRVKVKNMENGATVQPKFYCWMDHNTTDGICKQHGRNEVMEATANPVKVTARPAYDINIGVYSRGITYTTLDFNKGTTDAPNYGKGKIAAGWFPVETGISMRNVGNSANGLRGIEYPSGALTFDLEMSPYYYSEKLGRRVSDDLSSLMIPMVYFGDIHQYNTAGTNYGRTPAASGLPYDTAYGGIIPFGKGNNYNACYDGGNVSVKQEGDILHVTVKDYKFDGKHFPYGSDWAWNQSSVYYDLHNYGLGGQYTNTGFFTSQDYSIGVAFDYDTFKNKYGAGSAGLDIKVTNVHIKGRSGNEAPEVITSNNSISTSVPVRPDGVYDNRLFYEGNNKSNDYLQRFSASKSDCLGNKVKLWGGVTVHNYSKAYIFGWDTLVKFDAKAFEPTGVVSSGSNQYKNHILFAAKASGTDWSSEEEKANAKIEDMKYYKTYDDLKNDGKVCVGYLITSRALNDRFYGEYEHICSYIEAKISDDSAIANKAYSMVESTNIFCYEDGKQPNNLPFYDEYYFDGKPLAEPTRANFKFNYVAPKWDENGHYLGGGNHAMDTGDTMYIQPYSTIITKKVEQTVDNAQKTLFNLDNGEKIVDFNLQPAIKSSIKNGAKTTLTIVDTLPAGLKYSNDSVLGGTYQKGATDASHGTVKDGVAIEPKAVVENANGTTTITWELADVSISSPVPAIHYSAAIDIDKAQNNQVYKNVATISGTGDHSEQSEYNQNLSSVSIKVIKLFGFSISKIAQKEIYEIPEDISWDIAYNNHSKNAEPNVLMMDMMPYNGDEYGTNFHGSYTVKSLQLKLDDPTKYTFVYTLDESYRGKTTKDISADEARAKWTAGTIAADGTVSDMNGKTPVAWGIIGTLNGNTSLQGHLTIQTTGALADDDYFNGASMMKSNVLSHAAYVAHNISGYVFLDKNKNGTKDDGEPFMKGVTATLYKKGDRSAPVKNIDGKPCIATTGDDGFYEFEKTPKDDYEIVFTKNDMELYRITPEHKDAAGWTNKATHEALNGDKLQNASIDNVIGRSVVATQRDVLSRIAYHIDYTHLNLGLYLDKVKVPFTKVNTGKTPVSGAELKLLDEGGNTVDTWTTDGSEHIVYLYTGHSYLLKETKVPAGYLQAEDIKIEVDADGNIKTNGKNTDKIEMVDMKTMVLPNTGGGMAPWTVRYIVMAAGIALFALSRRRKYYI